VLHDESESGEDTNPVGWDDKEKNKMSNPIQPLEGMKTIPAAAAKTVDSIGKEYEEGKKALEKGEFGPAAVALHNALVGYTEKQDSSGIANASNQLGHLCLSREDYAGALNHYRRALTICEEAHDQMSILALFGKMVEVYKGLGDYPAAIDLCLNMLDIYNEHNDPRGTVKILEEMAIIYQKAGEPAKAADAYRTISSIHRNFRHDTTAARYLEKAENLAGVV
jgi:tetratricopeptide (TPR) repeat protein